MLNFNVTLNMLSKFNDLGQSKFLKPVRPLLRNRLVIFIGLSLPIVLFCLEFLLTGNLLAAGDSDYLMQTAEAMRRSILEFHQFPWWNPWVSGGVPLFANPQFGLLSITTPYVLLFGSIMGYKLVIFTYFLIGFWGFRSLFIRAFKTPVLTATLLSYIWTFGSFLTMRGGGGHYTFLVIQFFPWALLFYLRRNEIRAAWLKFGATIALMALTAAHNITIMSYAVLGLIILVEGTRIIAAKNNKYITAQITVLRSDLTFWLKAGSVFILLTSYRLFYTLQYLKDYPRLEALNLEPSIGLPKAWFAMFGPLRQFVNTPSIPPWGWLEASAYISIFTFFAALLVVRVFLANRKNQKLFSFNPYVLAILFSLFFLLSLGDFLGVFSPYSILRMLPVFASMRVSTRWLVWCSLIVLAFIAIYRGKQYRRAINVLLLLGCIELFIYCRPNLANPYKIAINKARPSSAAFEQKRTFNTHRLGIPYDENFTEATLSNYGQIIAGDSLVDTRWPPPWGTLTKRCSVDEGCDLVMSKNARITYWSPNRLVFERTADGPVQLNMNPGRGWTINKVYAFKTLKVVDSNNDFIINDPSDKLTVEYRPRLSVEWWLSKVTNR